MDFREVLATSEPVEQVAGRFGGRYLVRLSLILSASADVALGNHDRASKKLLAVREEMDSHRIVLDWRFRFPLQSALTELWLANGELAKAREDATRFVEFAGTTPDLTYQALALEARTRVALREKDFSTAESLIEKALSLIEVHPLPIATWRVHVTRQKRIRQWETMQ